MGNFLLPGLNVFSVFPFTPVGSANQLWSDGGQNDHTLLPSTLQSVGCGNKVLPRGEYSLPLQPRALEKSPRSIYRSWRSIFRIITERRASLISLQIILSPPP